MLDSKLTDDIARVSALRRYEVLDTPPEEPFDRITSIVQTLINVPMAMVSLVDAERQWFKSKQGLDVCEIGRDISFCSHTIRTREPMIVQDALLDDRFMNNPLVTSDPFVRFYAGVPLKTPDGYNIGALCVVDMKPREFPEAHIAILKSFADLVIGELELRRIAQRDHLTGAMTRRAFVAEVDKAIAEFRRHGKPSTLIMFDIDHFKKVNDVYGHPAGDRVLREVAATCGMTMRSNESFGRLGGEEFAFVQPDTTVQEALLSAERFRSVIESLVIHGDPPLKVTASFGVAQLSDDHQTSEDLIASADKALYEAKRSGRNRVCMQT